MKALLLHDAPPEFIAACRAAALQPIVVATVEQGRALIGREPFALVDGRVAQPRPLEEEIRHRVGLFYERLGAHSAGGLYDAVMREVERPLLAGALARANGVRATAAAALGIDRGTLARRLRALGIDERC